MAAVELYCKGAKVWLPDPNNVWRVAEIVEDFRGSVLKVEYENGEEVEKKELPIQSTKDLPHLKNPEFLIGENDLTSLSYLHEPAVLHSLQVRFERYQAIYTYCGIVLVAVNPYEELPIYGNDIVLAYRNKSQYGNLDPHIFAVAEEAYTKLERENRNQSIIVSGESGAGKTVSAKYAMRYFATAGGSATETQVEKKVLASNPIMEAIGNAKTTRNDNSSRFGKYIEIDFNSQYHIMGANMRTYLLEKSRVVFQSNEERNYHIFYQLCAAASLPEYQDLHLSHQDNFQYTNQGYSPYVDGVNDLDDFVETKRALTLLGFPDEFQRNLFKILAAILHLGNVRIQEIDQESCTILRDDPHLGYFSNLMGLTDEGKEEFRKWLCFRQIVSMREVFTKPVNGNEAIFARDALSKHIYSQLFNKIVSLINKSLASNAKSFRFIGVLDIYGFETFQINSFEQFCINYANEKLQQQFNQHVFKLEQEEYVRENIEWTFIEFYDNQPCIDLIENKLGILDLLDEECKFPKGSDQSWVSKLYDKCKNSSHFSKPRLSNTAFIITHFADKVQYQCEGFVEKNRDTVMEEQVNVLRDSKNPLMVQLINEEETKVQPSARMVVGTAPRGGGNLTVGSTGGKSGGSTMKQHKKTVGSQFRDSLTLLMNTLNATTPHYIRCIKPNDVKEAFVFDPRRAVQQLRACGVLETVRISAAGFPSRYPYEDFFSRYRVLFKTENVKRQDMKISCQTIIAMHIKEEDKYKFGKTKIFFRAGEVAYLEKLRLDRLRACGTLIQKTIRGWHYRKKYLLLRRSAICGQRLGRGFLARKRVRAMRENRAAIIIQRNVRMFIKRQQYLRLRCVTISLQARMRGALARQQYLAMVRHAKAVIIQKHVRGFLARRQYAKTMRGIVLIQCCWRRYLAKKLYKSLRVEARSIEHIKKLNKGLENKIISLQQRIDEVVKDSTALKTLQTSYAELKVQYEAAKGWESQYKLVDVQLANLARELAELKHELNQEREEKVDLVCEKDRLEKHLAEQESAWKTDLSNLRNELENLQAVLASKDIEAEETLKKRLEEERAMLDKEYDQERGAYQKLLQEHRVLEQRCDDLETELEQTKGIRPSAGPIEVKSHVRSLSDVSTISAMSDIPPTLTEDDLGYGSVKSSIPRPEAKKADYASSERFVKSPELSLKGDEFTLVLKLEQRIKTLEKDKLRLINQLEELEKERDSPGGEARRAQDLIRLQEVEMENAKLKDDLKSLRNSIATDNKGNLPVPADQLLEQFEALSDELDRRREECIQLRTVLSNHHVIPGSEPWGTSQRNSFMPQARPYGDGINEDGELNMVVSTQKMIIRQLEDELQAEKAKNERYVSELKEELEKLTLDNDRQQRLLAQNLNRSPQNQNEAVLQHEVARLMRENMELREKTDVATEQAFKYKLQLKHCVRKLKDAGVSLETLSDVTVEPKARRPEVPAVTVARKKDVEYMGMFEYRREDEAPLVRTIVYDLKPRIAATLLPGLPAYILFMCIRHTDYINDDEKVRSLLTSIIGAVKRVIRKRQTDMDTTILWLANTSRLLHSLKQYSGDKAFQKDNTPKQNEQCLRNFDLSEYRQVLSDIAVWIYQGVIKILEERVQSLVVSAVLEHEAISGLSGHRPGGQGMRGRSNSTAITHSASVDSAPSPVDPMHAMEALLHELNSFLKAMNVFGVDPPVVTQVFRQLFYYICASSLNNLLLRKDLCHWSKGMQIRFNLSHLEQWYRDSHIQELEPSVNVVDTLKPIIQAAQLLQARKSEEDVRAICDMCSQLSSAQIIKILNLYTPADESEERVTVAFIKQVQIVLAERQSPDQGTLLMDTKYSFPVRFPYSPSSIKLEDVEIPEMLNLPMLRKI